MVVEDPAVPDPDQESMNEEKKMAGNHINCISSFQVSMLKLYHLDSLYYAFERRDEFILTLSILDLEGGVEVDPNPDLDLVEEIGIHLEEDRDDTSISIVPYIFYYTTLCYYFRKY